MAHLCGSPYIFIGWYCSRTYSFQSLILANSVTILGSIPSDRLIYINGNGHVLLNSHPICCPWQHLELIKHEIKNPQNRNELIRKYFVKKLFSSSDIVKTLSLSKMVWDCLFLIFLISFWWVFVNLLLKVMKLYL